MKILIAPDKFKGTLTAREVCEALAKGLSKNKKHEIRQLPLADGGEGTQDIFLHHWSGTRVEVQAHDPLMRPIRSEYILSSDGKKAFVEMSRASGLSLLKESERNPQHTTTFGTGELVLHALNQGVEEVIMGIGGSATNDAGLGMLCAMGARILDKTDAEFIPRGETLGNINQIDLSLIHPRVAHVKFTALCDVHNPFHGEQGAAFVYAPQKGATLEQVKQLDVGLKHVAGIINQQRNIELQEIAGAGAGGGVAGGLNALLNANLKRGIDVIFDISNFDEVAQWADLIITGEGKVDEQTWQGKVVGGVAQRAQTLGRRVLIVCGQSELQNPANKQNGFIHTLSEAVGMPRAMNDTAKSLTELIYKIL